MLTVALLWQKEASDKCEISTVISTDVNGIQGGPERNNFDH